MHPTRDKYSRFFEFERPVILLVCFRVFRKEALYNVLSLIAHAIPPCKCQQFHGPFVTRVGEHFAVEVNGGVRQRILFL